MSFLSSCCQQMNFAKRIANRWILKILFFGTCLNHVKFRSRASSSNHFALVVENSNISKSNENLNFLHEDDMNPRIKHVLKHMGMEHQEKLHYAYLSNQHTSLSEGIKSYSDSTDEADEDRFIGNPW